MTDFFQDRQDDRLNGPDLIQQELRQFRKLQHLSNHDVAYRMATSLDMVKELRKQHNQLSVPLYDVKIDYAVRVILGQRKIKRTGKLFALSDRELLALPGIGKARLAHIREKLQEYFA